jgi:hypothetical protein
MSHAVEHLKETRPEAEVQTDKEFGKIVCCIGCQKPIIVNTFYAPAQAKCSACRPSEATKARGGQSIVQAGRTDPALADNLEKALVNPAFATALCPVHPDNPEHVMELLSINHNDRHGPGRWEGVGSSRAWIQIAVGETVMHQCQACKAVVTYSTTARQFFRRINEPREGKNANVWGTLLGTREEAV